MVETSPYWIASTGDDATYEALGARVRTNVAIVGGGITGVTTALLLKRAGVESVVLEADRLATGVTGHTTGKLTAGQGVRYSQIESSHDEDTARSYAGAQQAAFDLVLSLVGELGIECDLERVTDFVYAESEEEVETLEEELEASRRAGLGRVLDRAGGAPLASARAALALPDQAQLHPRKYVLGLAGAAHGGLCSIHESTRVLGIESGRTHIVSTESAEVEADHVVLATSAPITLEGLFFARAHPWQHYAVAAPVPADTLEGSWINAGSPPRSLRTTPLDGDRRLLVAVGERHKVGQSKDTHRHYDALEAFLRHVAPGARVEYRWSAHEQFSVDGLPYIGRVGGPDSTLHVATGFGAWGLLNGTLAGLEIRDSILDRESTWCPIFDPGRSTLTRAPVTLVRENVAVAKELIGGKLRRRPDDVDEIEDGSGSVVQLDGASAAVHRDDDGVLHAVSAVCTHMGCIVEWNDAERTWDCPCHGSRFDTEGQVLHGPATQPLEPIALASEEPAGVDAA
jgi:glycine/D-amino acid oxidase-like deaminating enzyme/nitrite reductase/ring-hydroxylating ferredoxin subunit